MLKNLVIALLATGLLFSNTILSEYGWLPYIATSMVAFMVIFAIEMFFEDYMARRRRLMRLRGDINRDIALNQPTAKNSKERFLYG